MKKLILLFLPLLFIQCSNEQNKSAAPADKDKTRVETAAQIVETPATVEPENTPNKKDGPGLNLWVGSAEVKKGEEVCIDISASEIEGLLSMQYSMRWDPKTIEFKAIQGFTIPTMDLSDFGRHLSEKGTLTAVWIDDTLNGVNTQDGDVLFQLCFTAVGEAGSASPVRFWSSPTPYEVVVLPETVIPLTAHKGNISIK
jgi:hypothetical protein